MFSRHRMYHLQTLRARAIGKCQCHDDVIKWKHFPRDWTFVRGIHRSLINSHHNGPWRGALMFSLIYARTNDWVNNRDAGDLGRHRPHYDLILMVTLVPDFFVSLLCQGLWHRAYKHGLIYIKWTVFVNVATKSAQHTHARMITTVVEKVQTQSTKQSTQHI